MTSCIFLGKFTKFSTQFPGVTQTVASTAQSRLNDVTCIKHCGLPIFGASSQNWKVEGVLFILTFFVCLFWEVSIVKWSQSLALSKYQLCLQVTSQLWFSIVYWYSINKSIFPICSCLSTCSNQLTLLIWLCWVLGLKKKKKKTAFMTGCGGSHL